MFFNYLVEIGLTDLSKTRAMPPPLLALPAPKPSTALFFIFVQMFVEFTKNLSLIGF